MQCYTELTPPTAVTHSLSLPFLSSTANNLVIIKTSLLQIFSLKSIIASSNEHASGNQVSAHARPERVQTTRLVLIAECELAGTVTSIARVKILQSKSGGEALLVALRDAKLSLVQWDPEKFSISTISIHYYEREDILASPWEQDLAKCGTILSVDSSSRCAVFKFGARHIAILPFRQLGDDIAMDDYDPDLDGEGAKLERKDSLARPAQNGELAKTTPYTASFVLSLLALDPALKHPVHLSFLYEYREPTFGVLSSQNITSTALLGERRDIMSYAVYNLDLEQKASTTLLSVTNLPFDLFKILPLSRIIGGALLIGSNELIHIDQSGKSIGIAVNEAAKHCTSFTLTDQASLNLRLESCLIKQLGSETPELLIIEPNGALLILSFKVDGRSVSGLMIRRVERDHLLANPSCAATIGRGRMFVGSEGSDSVVLGWSRLSDRLKRQRSRKDIQVETEDDELTDLDNTDLENDEDDLYADDKPEVSKPTVIDSSVPAAEGDYTFRVHDSLMNIGPLSDVTFGHASMNAEEAEDILAPYELMTVSGQGDRGSLLSFQTAIMPYGSRQFEMSDAKAVWSISANNTQRTLGADANEFDKYLVANFDDESTRVFNVRDEDLEEVQNIDLDPDVGSIIACGTLNGGTRIVQVSQREVRAFDAGELSHFLLFLNIRSIFDVVWIGGGASMEPTHHPSFPDLLLPSDLRKASEVLEQKCQIASIQYILTSIA